VVIWSGPPEDVTVTVAVFVEEPEALVAWRVYVVVAVGLTLVEPLADVEVKVPGVMVMEVAAVVDQLRELLEPELMLVGLAAKEFIVGTLPAGVTVTVAVIVAEPAEFVAVSV